MTTDVRPLGCDRRRRRSAASCPPALGVVAIPNVVFYDDVDAGRTVVRFAFCKRREVLEEAVRRLRAARTVSR